MKFGFGFGFPYNGSLMGVGTSRYFTTLDGVADYFTIPTVTLTGAFEIEFDFSTTDILLYKVPLGTLANNTNRILLYSSTSMEVRVNSISKTYTTPTMDDGKLHNIKIVRNVSNDIEVFFNGVSLGSQNRSGTFIADTIGTDVDNYFVDGVIANLKITDENGTLIRDYPIDESWGDANNMVLRNRATTLGVELITNRNFTSDTVWVKGVGYTISNDALHINANNTYTYNASTPFPLNTAYLVEGTISNYVSGIIKFAPHSVNLGGTLRSANGTYTEVIFSSSGGSEFFIDCDGVTVADVESVSAKQADGYGTAVSITSANAELFTIVGSDWLGAELITNGGFDADTDWVKGAGWTISGGVADFDGAGFNSISQANTGSVIGQVYQIKTDVITNTGSGGNNIQFGLNVDGGSHKPVGSYTFIHVNDSSDSYFFYGRAGEPCSIDNVSAKRILEAP